MNVHAVALALEAKPAPWVRLDERGDKLRNDAVSYLDVIDDDAVLANLEANWEVV